MSKNRYINTYFWDDKYIVNLDPIEKLLFLYVLTNPLTTICGCYETTLKRIAFDTGIDKDMLLKIFDRFEKDNKIKYFDGWIAIKNFVKHQKVSENENDKINKGIKIALEKIPESLKNWIENKKTSPLKPLPEDETPLADPLNYSNLNLNLNLNLNSNVNNDAPSQKNELKQTFLNFYKQLSFDDEYINSLFKIPKERENFWRLIKKFDNVDDFKKFLEKTILHDWVKKLKYTPSSIINKELEIRAIQQKPKSKYDDPKYLEVIE
jgi:hypothetical protein